MRQLFIVHIGNYLIQPDSGVYKKYHALFDVLQAHVPTRLIAFTDRKSTGLHGVVEVVNVQRSNKWQVLADWISMNVKDDDVIWLRYPFACKGLFELTKKFGNRIVFEHNTNEIVEAAQIQKRAWQNMEFVWHKFFSRSFWKYTWRTWISNETEESEWGRKCLSNVRGGISVTFELANQLKDRYENYQVFVLPNCVSNSDFEFGRTSKPVGDNKKVKLVMMIGSYDYWQGWDRILKSAQVDGKLQSDIVLDIYGQLPSKDFESTHPSIVIRNFAALSNEEMNNVLPHYDMGIGTLQLYRKKMQEACPLKVRDYWRFGLPCLMGYTDTVLKKYPVLKSFNYVVENNDSNLPWNDIIQFVHTYNSDNVNKQEVNDLYKQAISYEGYATDLINYLFKK